jgi:hypothetical protein
MTVNKHHLDLALLALRTQLGCEAFKARPNADGLKQAAEYLRTNQAELVEELASTINYWLDSEPYDCSTGSRGDREDFHADG